MTFTPGAHHGIHTRHPSAQAHSSAASGWFIEGRFIAHSYWLQMRPGWLLCNVWSRLPPHWQPQQGTPPYMLLPTSETFNRSISVLFFFCSAVWLKLSWFFFSNLVVFYCGQKLSLCVQLLWGRDGFPQSISSNLQCFFPFHTQSLVGCNWPLAAIFTDLTSCSHQSDLGWALHRSQLMDSRPELEESLTSFFGLQRLTLEIPCYQDCFSLMPPKRYCWFSP